MNGKILSEISKNYAKALLESTADGARKDNEYYIKQLDEILEVFTTSDDLKVVMANSSVSAGKKIEILEEVFKDKIDKKILNLLKILVDKNRFSELDSIITYYKQKNEKQENKKTIEIVSPIELNNENKTKVLSKLEQKFNCDILPVWTTDKSLIAGLVFKIDDYVVDTSIKAKLEDLKKTLNRG